MMWRGAVCVLAAEVATAVVLRAARSNMQAKLCRWKHVEPGPSTARVWTRVASGQTSGWLLELLVASDAKSRCNLKPGSNPSLAVPPSRRSGPNTSVLSINLRGASVCAALLH